MSQDDITRTTESINPSGEPESAGLPGTDQVMAQGEAATAGEAENAPTIGTGTSIALGCIAGTILLIGIGLIYLLIAAII